MAQPQTRIEDESVEALLARAYEHAYDQGWTDGLPIIPATPAAVQRFVAASGRAAEDVIGLLPPRKGRATVEAIAVNADTRDAGPAATPAAPAQPAPGPVPNPFKLGGN